MTNSSSGTFDVLEPAPALLSDPPDLPPQWTNSVKEAMIHVIALAQFSLGQARGLAVRAGNLREPTADQLRQELALLREEIRLKDARMGRVPPRHRPYYEPTERLQILELRAARAWSLAQTARVFQVTDATIASWTKRVAEEGPQALLRTTDPVNKFPDFVRHAVQRLQTLCPRLGKVKIAQILARAGLHLSSTTVGRMRCEKPVPTPNPQPEQPASVPAPQLEPAKPEAKMSPPRITSRYPDHVWLVDLTTVSLLGGAWTAWLPFALPHCFPFCWWLCVALDHYSRRVMGVSVFWKQPTADQVKQFLGRVIGKDGRSPRHLITDQGSQFTSDTFRRWCKRRGIRQRFGAIGQHGSIAVIERFIRTLKESLGGLSIIPLGRRSFLWQVQQHARWYNESRPHTSLGGATPDEVYFERRPANQYPRFEPRSGWPRASPCARPQTLVKGQPGVRLTVSIEVVAGHRHLPIVRLNRAS